MVIHPAVWLEEGMHHSIEVTLQSSDKSSDNAAKGFEMKDIVNHHVAVSNLHIDPVTGK